MKNKKEHILALKISLWLLVIAFTIVPIVFYGLDKRLLFELWIDKHFVNRYVIFFFLSIFIYIISYFFAKKAFEPITIANKKLKEYNHNVAHELKTPLAVIKSDLELLEMWKKLDLDIIKSSKEEIESMQNIIDSLLFLSQKQESIEFENIDLSIQIKNCIKNKFSKNKNDFNITDKSNTKKIKVNKNLFTILIKNLLENAVKYWDRKDKIEIILEKNKLIIKNKISESIKNLDKEKLFETFYQADNSRSTSWYGLGLNIIKKVVELHKAEINIDIKNNYFIVNIEF